MKITVLVTLMVFLAYFLVLYGGVGFIQDKRFFSSAPKENLDAIPDTKERFPGAHSIGWVIEIIAILLFLAAAALSVWDGVRNGFGFLDFFVRFLAVLYAMETYDIIFFDWVSNGLAGDADHVGIVEKVENGRIYTIEGNSDDSVRQNSYPVGYLEIRGFGCH